MVGVHQFKVVVCGRHATVHFSGRTITQGYKLKYLEGHISKWDYLQALVELEMSSKVILAAWIDASPTSG